ncbi:hypothetical protein GCM10009755_01980 [Brevibacterium samyangense]|uniref:Transketolase n=1 Tax=Brevibacterium samyangense TaxID=366888 RepID=A0ABP5EM77_9MICO
MAGGVHVPHRAFEPGEHDRHTDRPLERLPLVEQRAIARELALSGTTKRVTPVGLPDEFLDAGALPTLYDRYGVSTAKIVERVKGLL